MKQQMLTAGLLSRDGTEGTRTSPKSQHSGADLHSFSKQERSAFYKFTTDTYGCWVGGNVMEQNDDLQPHVSSVATVIDLLRVNTMMDTAESIEQGPLSLCSLVYSLGGKAVPGPMIIGCFQRRSKIGPLWEDWIEVKKRTGFQVK